MSNAPTARVNVPFAWSAATETVPVVVNGGLRTRDEVIAALDRFDGAMIGREAYHRPELLAELERALHPEDPPPPDAVQILQAMHEYARDETGAGTPLNAITRHMLGLLSGRPGAKALRQQLSEDTQQGRPVNGVFGRAIRVASGTL